MKLILGGPGCGKTTRLLDIVRSELEAGVESSRIAFVAFTKAAAEEAKARAAAAFGLDPETDLPWFRTIHSLAYRRLNMTRGELLDKTDWKEFAEWIGESITGVYETDSAQGGGKKGDRLLRVIDYAATTMVPLQDAYYQVGEMLEWAEVERFDSAFRRFKTHVGKVDFTDMLLNYAEDGKPLPVEVAVVDEAQDLTAAQWSAVRLAFREARRVYIGGDDDQAIYRWAGADVNTFLGLSQAPEVLEFSHRLPRSVFEVGQTIAQRISHRYHKPYKPDNREGAVIWHQDPFDVDLGSKGSWLLLARNGYMLEALEETVRSRGIPYVMRGQPSVDHAEVLLIALWQRLQREETKDLSATELRGMYRLMGRPRPALKELQRYDASRLPLNVSWYSAMEGIPEARRNFYVSALRAGESLLIPPRIRIETIHGVKGAEADRVMVLLDMSFRTSEAFTSEPDHEHRVFYVAVTRAREELHLITPQTSINYTV